LLRGQLIVLDGLIYMMNREDEEEKKYDEGV